jgi:cobalt/nickel transport system ATP-binding protein
MDNNILFDIKDATYSYSARFKALSAVTLSVRAGERVALLGANGSGKSTLLMVFAGLLFPDTGLVRFSGNELTENWLAAPEVQRSFRSSVGIVFQSSDVQLFNSNVRDELLFGLVQLGLPEPEREPRLAKYISLMDIGHLVDRHPQNLSVGEKKRVAIAAVLAMEPQVLLLDEPTAGLDPRTSRHLIDAIAVFSEEHRTVITATQDIHIVTEIADRIIVMGEDKRIVRDGAAEEILKDIAFLEAHNLIHAHAHRHKDTVHVHPHEHPSHDHTHGA